MIKSLAIIMAILLCLALLIYKRRKKEPAELSDFVRCAMTGIVVPPLIYCLYVLVFSPLDMNKLQDSIQYLGLGVLVALFVTLSNFAKVFSGGRSP